MFFAIMRCVPRGIVGQMIYWAYQTQTDMMEPARAFARFANNVLEGPFGALASNPLVRTVSAAYEMISRAELTHTRPSFDIPHVMVGNREAVVTEEIAHVAPFGTLLRFKKDVDVLQPRVLLVAPLSGHFATLLRGTIRTLLADHEVYVTDWHNARDVSLSEGSFGFNDYVAHVIKFLEVIGPGAHVIAVCQPCVQVLAAVSIMAEENNPAQPRSMTLMAGPIDTRINPPRSTRLRKASRCRGSKKISLRKCRRNSPVPVAASIRALSSYLPSWR